MYVHIGGECTISDKFIVGIFDFDGTTTDASDTVNFIRRAEEDGRVEIVSPDIPRSFVVTMDRVYITPISAATLKRRLSRGTMRFAADHEEQATV
jgi:extracellular matrix regulatory protein B